MEVNDRHRRSRHPDRLLRRADRIPAAAQRLSYDRRYPAVYPRAILLFPRGAQLAAGVVPDADGQSGDWTHRKARFSL